jgi:hypothetical protein
MLAKRYGMAPVSKHQHNGDFPGIDASRRSFITKFAAAVFAAPAITSFALDGIAHAADGHRDGKPRHRHHHANQSLCNQTLQNQTLHNQTLFNQCVANQHLHNQHLHNQAPHTICLPNQTEVPWLPWERDTDWWTFGECLPFDHHNRRRGLWFR